MSDEGFDISFNCDLDVVLVSFGVILSCSISVMLSEFSFIGIVIII